ncbi:hypothetical protein [Corynebacterium freiburgense]|uniref:hypothetical protein n=1 Tax=Corynebacterium freiburgense TaxID=556548 RepID=UPI00040B2F11|nr:hypothetical protein [Corynebacterium freiburgense]WJZ01375.1 hypothetical protein CFREI_00290 [Corynebacterium freiburgense]
MNNGRSRSRFRPLDIMQQTSVQKTTVNAFELENRRKIRSAEILQAVRNLDHTQDDAYRLELIQWIENAYAERMGGVLTGLFSKCYLGHPYIDHRLTITGNIIEHYTRAETPPPPYDKARPFILSGAYEFVEVYSDGEVIPISADGSPS